MDKEDKKYIDLGLLGCNEEDNSVLTESILKYDDSSFRLIKGDVDFENYIKTNIDNFDIRAVALKNETPVVYYLVGNAFDFNHELLIKKFVKNASFEDVKHFILDDKIGYPIYPSIMNIS